MSRLRHMVGSMWRAGMIVAVGGTVLASSCSTSEVRTVLGGVTDLTNQLDQANHDNVSFGDWFANLLNK